MSERTIAMIQDALRATVEVLRQENPATLEWSPSMVMQVTLATLADQLTPEDDREDAAEDAG